MKTCQRQCVSCHSDKSEAQGQDEMRFCRSCAANAAESHWGSSALTTRYGLAPSVAYTNASQSIPHLLSAPTSNSSVSLVALSNSTFAPLSLHLNLRLQLRFHCHEVRVRFRRVVLDLLGNAQLQVQRFSWTSASGLVRLCFFGDNEAQEGSSVDSVDKAPNTLSGSRITLSEFLRRAATP